MSGYLQRLLDRAAAMPAMAPAPGIGSETVPVLNSGSPILAYDQRLAAGLGDDFNILGVPPDISSDPMAGMQDSAEAPVPSAAALPLPIPSPQIAGADRALPERGAASIAIQMGAGSEIVTDPAARQPAKGLPPKAAGSDPTPPSRPPLPQEAAADARPLPPAPLLPVSPEPRLATAPAPLSADTPFPAERAEPAKIRDGVATPATALAARPVPSIAPVKPAAAEKQLPETQSAPLARPAEVQPVPIAPPPPLAGVASTGVDPRLVEQIVRDAVRSELGVAAPSKEQRAPALAIAGNNGDDKAAPPRPRTAQEASVIGALEASSRPLTIYGLRRR